MLKLLRKNSQRCNSRGEERIKILTFQQNNQKCLMKNSEGMNIDTAIVATLLSRS